MSNLSLMNLQNLLFIYTLFCLKILTNNFCCCVVSWKNIGHMTSGVLLPFLQHFWYLVVMESTESRFAHLLQPIRELTKNWDVDVASELNDYLEEVQHTWPWTWWVGGEHFSGCFCSCSWTRCASRLMVGKPDWTLLKLLCWFKVPPVSTARRWTMWIQSVGTVPRAHSDWVSSSFRWSSCTVWFTKHWSTSTTRTGSTALPAGFRGFLFSRSTNWCFWLWSWQTQQTGGRVWAQQTSKQLWTWWRCSGKKQEVQSSSTCANANPDNSQSGVLGNSGNISRWCLFQFTHLDLDTSEDSQKNNSTAVSLTCLTHNHTCLTNLCVLTCDVFPVQPAQVVPLPPESLLPPESREKLKLPLIRSVW